MKNIIKLYMSFLSRLGSGLGKIGSSGKDLINKVKIAGKNAQPQIKAAAKIVKRLPLALEAASDRFMKRLTGKGVELELAKKNLPKGLGDLRLTRQQLQIRKFKQDLSAAGKKIVSKFSNFLKN